MPRASIAAAATKVWVLSSQAGITGTRKTSLGIATEVGHIRFETVGSLTCQRGHHHTDQG